MKLGSSTNDDITYGVRALDGLQRSPCLPKYKSLIKKKSATIWVA